MSDFITMKTRVADELARNDLATFIGKEINTAVKHYESTRVRWTEVKEFSLGNTASGTRYYTVPNDFIRADSLKINYSGALYDLVPRTWEYIEHQDNQDSPTLGVPNEYVVYADQFRLWPVPDGVYALLLSYLKRENDLVNDTDTNSWMTFGEELIRSRTKAAVEIKYLRKPAAIAEAAQLSAQGKRCLSYCELIARDSLLHETQQALSTGRLRSKELG